MWVLRVEGPDAPSTFWLPAGTFVVGRKVDSCDIAVKDMTVSRKHGTFLVQSAAVDSRTATLTFTGAAGQHAQHTLSSAVARGVEGQHRDDMLTGMTIAGFVDVAAVVAQTQVRRDRRWMASS